MKKSRLIFILLLLGLCSICTAGWLFFLYSPTVKEPHGIVYYLKPGTAKSTLIADLSAQKIISSPSLFSLSLYSQVILSAGHGHLKTGEYLFPYGSTPASILKQVTSGTGYYYRSFTIVPGWTFAQLREELKKTDTLRHSIHSLTDQNIMERLGDATLPAEGEFFPETYLYTRGVADLVILKQAFNLMQQRLQTAWQTRVSQLPYLNPYQVLIAASLVEKEAYLKSEMPMIAGVLVNRLTKNMLLQFDPTVIYGMKTNYTGKIYKSDLATDTAYNTYVHKGLPPTPIALPSMDAIQAVTHPMQHQYFYFVAKGDGSHQFSETLVEHNKAVSGVSHRSTHFFNEGMVRKYLNGVMNKSSLRGACVARMKCFSISSGLHML